MERRGGRRLLAMVAKEFIQMRRDRTTFALILGIPLLELILFGFAINTNPRYLPTAIVNPDYSNFGRRILTAMENSTYFRFLTPAATEEQARALIKTGRAQFVVNFPPHFTRDLVKGLKPSLLLEVDGTDPVASGRAINVFQDMASLVFQEELVGSLASLAVKQNNTPYAPIVHAKYNPLAITAYNIVPGLLGVVLTMTMVVITASILTRELERGTLENILATPLKPIEVMLGKIIPYIVVAYLQVLLILGVAKFVFHVPMQGSILLLLLLCLPFIAANLAVGMTFSTFVVNQLQAVQVAMFFFLPSILLSGFMFPFRGMPFWAQCLGNILPLTHFVIIVRGILLKGNNFIDVWPQVIPIILFTVIAMFIAVKRYRKTLD